MMDPGLAGVLGGAAGAIITALGTFAVNFFRARREEARRDDATRRDEKRKDDNAVIAQYAVLCDRQDRQIQEQRLETDRLYEAVIALTVEHRQCHESLNEMRAKLGMEPVPIKEHPWTAASLANAEFRQRTNQQREQALQAEHQSLSSIKPPATQGETNVPPKGTDCR